MEKIRDYEPVKVDSLVRQMYFAGFQATHLARGVEIIREMNRMGEKTVLLITGPPDPHQKGKEYFGSLKELIKEESLNDKIIFLSEFKNKGNIFEVGFNLLRSLYCISDFLLITSYQEGFGIPILEGGVFKLPVFCTNIETLKEVGGEEVFYFSIHEKPERIAGKIIKVLKSSPSISLSHRVLREYDWERVLDKHLLPLINTMLV